MPYLQGVKSAISDGGWLHWATLPLDPATKARLDRTNAQYAEEAAQVRDLADAKYVAADEGRLRAQGYQTSWTDEPTSQPELGEYKYEECGELPAFLDRRPKL